MIRKDGKQKQNSLIKPPTDVLMYNKIVEKG